mmetsp:Transcript_17612/g.21686  ORF Transcript_17612/g.21686 Transcript_17612/m.21686 type:complete len:305 (-) Transcript_17612:982-1896(-)
MWFDISLPTAVAGCLGIASSFVGSLYLLPRSIQNLSHDNPTRIWYRFGAVSLVCVGTPVALFLLGKTGTTGMPMLEWIGIRKEGLVSATVLPLGLFVTLFLGPIAHHTFSYFQEPVIVGRDKNTSLLEFLNEFFPNFSSNSAAQLRNILVAPISEELCFRACMAPLLLSAGLSNSMIITCAPLFFGVAHLHHAIDHVRDGWSISQVVKVVAVQFTYTSIFGALEMFIYLRTGHLASICLIHMWCNLLGLPPLSFLNAHSPVYEHRQKIGLAYGIGIVGFIAGLFPLTDPSIYGCKLWMLNSIQN